MSLRVSVPSTSKNAAVRAGPDVSPDIQACRATEPERRTMPLVLAGGLDEGNVSDAIARVRPFAVDVSSGVETAPGIKSAGRIARFCADVRLADRRECSKPDDE